MLKNNEPAEALDGAAAAPGSQVESHYVIPGDVSHGLLLVCDHARNAMPPEYDNLGMPRGELQRHIAYDIGVEAVTRGLAVRLGVPAVLSCFSRLLIDPNRGLDDPTLIMRLSDGAVVPGNAEIDAKERARRIARFHQPYHDAVTTLIDQAIEVGQPPAILSIHSFTPIWKGIPRPWHAGVLFASDSRFSDELIDALSREPGLVVGANEPYSGALQGDSMHTHGICRGLVHSLLEIRQDLIDDDAGIAEWTELLARVLEQLLPDLRALSRQHQR